MVSEDQGACQYARTGRGGGFPVRGKSRYSVDLFRGYLVKKPKSTPLGIAPKKRDVVRLIVLLQGNRALIL